ncbi:MAG: HD domain-containing protein [Actinomycetota bacterium]|nr:HD domain-containing protein [Actinomycetota bacterium]
MRRNLFGHHLYSQIVSPLIVASLIVGIVATMVAVFFLSSLTDRWVDQVAEASMDNLAARFDARVTSIGRVAKLAAQSADLTDALSVGDYDEIRGILVGSNVALQFDNMALLDSDGVVIASTGFSDVDPGVQFLRGDQQTWVDLSMSHAAFVNVGERETLTALQPVVSGSENDVYTLAVSQVIDESFLDDLSGGAEAAFCFYSGAYDRVACASKSVTGTAVTSAELQEAVKRPDPAIRSALNAAAISDEGHGVSTFSLSDVNYRVRAQCIELLDDSAVEQHAYLVAIVSQELSDDAGRTTRNLIIAWSIVAVFALIVLGGWVARRVSDPLIVLSEGATRIAQGDFSTKVSIRSSNEIGELAETFNQMTDSLRERSESLTKKVLELATLYEMSRALGSTFEMPVLLDSVLDSALRIVGVELGYVMLRNKESDQLELIARRGPDPGSDGATKLRSSMSEWVVREGRPLIYNPVKGDDEQVEVDPMTGALAALCVPLMSSEGTIGSITVGSKDAEFRFNSDDVRLLSTIANHMTIAIGNIELFISLQEAYLATVRSLAAAVDAKDPFTRGHSDRVAQFATLIAEHMGLSHDQRIALEMAAYLHDIGKIGIKEEILLKPGRLTDDEMGQMRHHPLIGANILKPVAFPWPITPVVRHHHEHYNGAGYPAGLQGEEIPLLARILTAADAFEAMIADRPYRKGRTEGEAVEELERCAGTHFDPRVVEVFVEALAERAHGVDLNTGIDLSEVQSEEVRAIFVALSDGMFLSFRRLGGPRLASNVERDLSEFLVREELPFMIAHGRMAVGDMEDLSREEQLEAMRSSLRYLDAIMGRLSGHTLVDHFYTDALSSLSERMRDIARALGLYEHD